MLKKLLMYGITAGMLVGGISKKSNAQIHKQNDSFITGNISIRNSKYERGFVDDKVFPFLADFKIHTPSKTNSTLFLGVKGIVSLATNKAYEYQALDALEGRLGYQYEGESLKSTVSADYYPYHFNGETKTLEAYADAYFGNELKIGAKTYYNIFKKGFGLELEANYNYEVQDIPIKTSAGIILNSNYYQQGTGIKGLFASVSGYTGDFKFLSLYARLFYNLSDETFTPYAGPERLNLNSKTQLDIGITLHLDSRKADKKSKISCKNLIKTQRRRK